MPLEIRSSVSAGSGSGDTHTVTASGNLGASSTTAMSATVEKWVTGTLNANHAATITPAAGGLVRLFVTQDATGGRTLTIGDGSTSSVVTIAAAASTLSIIDVFSADGVDLLISVR
jgi:hypothetical protein